MTEEWPDESRIDEIGQNGNTGEHYDLQQIDKMESELERSLEFVRELRRELINKHNLNKSK